MINEENLTTTGDTARIKEVFASIQGEGPYVKVMFGYFLRL